MEPISAIALSLALGAGATAGKEVVSSLVKDAYTKLKDLVSARYPKVSIEQLEQSPSSKNRRAVVEEDLAQVGAEHDAELVAAARKLIELVQSQSPSVAPTIGVEFEDLEAANLRLSDIESSGTGVKLGRGRFTGDVEIRNVSAGVSPGNRLKDQD